MSQALLRHESSSAETWVFLPLLRYERRITKSVFVAIHWNLSILSEKWILQTVMSYWSHFTSHQLHVDCERRLVQCMFRYQRDKCCLIPADAGASSVRDLNIVELTILRYLLQTQQCSTCSDLQCLPSILDTRSIPIWFQLSFCARVRSPVRNM